MYKKNDENILFPENYKSYEKTNIELKCCDKEWINTTVINVSKYVVIDEIIKEMMKTCSFPNIELKYFDKEWINTTVIERLLGV